MKSRALNVLKLSKRFKNYEHTNTGKRLLFSKSTSLKAPLFITSKTSSIWSFKLPKRAAHTHAKLPDIPIDAEGGLVRITLPIQSGLCVFPIYPDQTVGQFLESIREEDPNIKSLVLLSVLDSARVSHTTTLEECFKDDLIIEIDGNRFLIEGNEHLDLFDDVHLDETLHVRDIDSLVQRAYASKIRNQLESDPRVRMPLQEFYNWCTEYNLNEKQSQTLLRSLKHCGVVVHFSENEDLNKYIFLKPEVIFNALSESLNMNLLRKTDMEKMAELLELEEKLKTLDAEKQTYEIEAEKYARIMLWGGLVYLVSQFLILARMVWIDFNWDIMEPITFFVTYTTIMGGYLFFLFNTDDYTYPKLSDVMKNRRLRTLYIRNRFNWKEWNEMDVRRQEIKKDLNIS